jgi:hypothetical protein
MEAEWVVENEEGVMQEEEMEANRVVENEEGVMQEEGMEAEWVVENEEGVMQEESKGGTREAWVVAETESSIVA